MFNSGSKFIYLLEWVYEKVLGKNNHYLPLISFCKQERKKEKNFCFIWENKWITTKIIFIIISISLSYSCLLNFLVNDQETWNSFNKFTCISDILPSLKILSNYSHTHYDKWLITYNKMHIYSRVLRVTHHKT